VQGALLVGALALSIDGLIGSVERRIRRQR
jgi:osmoprotectant transport system permease protein